MFLSLSIYKIENSIYGTLKLCNYKAWTMNRKTSLSKNSKTFIFSKILYIKISPPKAIKYFFFWAGLKAFSNFTNYFWRISFFFPKNSLKLSFKSIFGRGVNMKNEKLSVESKWNIENFHCLINNKKEKEKKKWTRVFFTQIYRLFSLQIRKKT